MTGDWTVTPSRNLLARGEEEVRVEPRVMDVLVHLAERAGEVVSKEELVERAWEGRYVTDDVLTVTIYALRKALGDDARRPRFLETVSRRGYRWIAPVAPGPTTAAAPSPAGGAATDQAKAEAPPARRAPWWTGARVAALLLFAVGAAWVLTPSRRSRHVPAADSQEAYVKGRYFLDQRSIKGWQQSLEQFQRAVALDPQSPAAQAGLADTYSAMSDFGVASPAEMRPQAMKAAHRALELDPQSAEGYGALGRAQFLFDWDFASAERSLVRAVVLDANYMPAYQTTAWLRSAQGHHAEAIEAARKALQLDPVNTARYNELAWVLALGGRFDEALRETGRALQVNPRSFETYLMKGWILRADRTTRTRPSRPTGKACASAASPRRRASAPKPRTRPRVCPATTAPGSTSQAAAAARPCRTRSAPWFTPEWESQTVPSRCCRRLSRSERAPWPG